MLLVLFFSVVVVLMRNEFCFLVKLRLVMFVVFLIEELMMLNWVCGNFVATFFSVVA